ncbi:S8 family serine peptidase [Pontibacillus salicampi]|uniref:S8 family serine peptidase n=1 Tax=Pontibacillus salicampi TaxID=1449801 RepID=A0ABV6LMP3_9BACI
MNWKWLLLFLLQCLLAFMLLFDFDTDETVVAVLDSGVDTSHPIFQDRLLPGYDLIDWDFHPEDTMGHGTQVSGIISQLNEHTSVKVLPVKKLGSPHNTPLAIMLAVMNGADIVNMSFHQPYNPMTQLAIRYGNYKGVLFIASSGNDGEDTLTYPAKYKEVIPVAATDYKNSVLSGNYGEGITYISPGINMLSASLHGDFTTVSGTSMASAYAAGVFAYLKEVYPEASNEQLIQYVNQYSRTMVYNVGKEHRELKTLDMNKFKAVATEESYLWFSNIDWSADETMAPTIKLDSYNVDKVHVHDNGRYYKTITEGQHSIMLPSQDGEHEVRIFYHDGIDWQHRDVAYEIDSTSPELEAHTTLVGNTTKLELHINEKNLDYVLINGIAPKSHIGYGPDDASPEEFHLYVEKHPILIEVFDTFGNSTIEVIP